MRFRFFRLLPLLLLLCYCAEENPLPPAVLDAISTKQSIAVDQDITYSGEYLCGQGATGLTLQILGRHIYGFTYAIFHFFPIAANPSVPAGSYVVKGAYDNERGLMDLQPDSWITRPFAYTAVGLRGVSSDRGATFEGQVTNSLFLCSTFFLHRTTR